jgi:hypothetical protein
VALTKVAPFAPMMRRDGVRDRWRACGRRCWLCRAAAPAVALDVLPLAAASGAIAATVAIVLSTLTGSSFAARLVLCWCFGTATRRCEL